jgi:hypothetical protein
MEIFSTKLTSQQHQHKDGNLQHEAGINNISTKLEIFSTRLASTTSTRSWKSSARGWHQQHQHESRNLQHEAGITTTSERRWKSLAQGWHQHHVVL